MMRRDPIVIVPYDPNWAQTYEQQRARLEPVLQPWLVRPMEHMGSTSVPGLAAKAIVDMLAVVRTIDELPPAAAVLHAVGWVHAPEPDDDAGRRLSFCTPSVANRTHHRHVVEEASGYWRGWLAFRDYLRVHASVADRYAALKRELAVAHGGDPNRRDAYRLGKARFIREVTALGLAGPAR